MKTTKVKVMDLDLVIPHDMMKCTQEVFAGRQLGPEYELTGLNLGMKTDQLQVLDIGFCFGLFSIYALKTWPGCQIVAFEPNTHLCHLGVKNIEKNKEKFQCSFPTQSTVNLFNKAVSDSSGLVIYNPGGQNAGCGTITPDRNPGNEYKAENDVEVEVIDADMLSNKFHIVKVDTEGSEVPILSRMKLDDTIVVMYEYHNPDDRVILEKLMQDKGYILLKCNSYSMYTGTCVWVNKKAIR